MQTKVTVPVSEAVVLIDAFATTELDTSPKVGFITGNRASELFTNRGGMICGTGNV